MVESTRKRWSLRMENQQSTSETQSSQKKQWHTTWWGAVLVILFLPISAIWFIWAKTKLGTLLKSTLTVVVVFFALVVIAGSSSPDNQPTDQQSQQQASAPTQEAKSENALAPQAPQYIFDVPSLIGKNIDEVKSVLGEPSIFNKPSVKELALDSNKWDMDFVKNNVDLSVSYNVKTKFIYDFFILGSDKQQVLTAGNLKEDASDYNIQFQPPIHTDSNITGVIIAKRLSDTLDAGIGYGLNGVGIVNNEDYNWSNCKVEVNPGLLGDGYSDQIGSINSKDSKVASFFDLTKDSQRFNILVEKPEKICLTCDTDIQKGRGGCSNFH